MKHPEAVEMQGGHAFELSHGWYFQWIADSGYKSL
jgi:hypothetical protein